MDRAGGTVGVGTAGLAGAGVLHVLRHHGAAIAAGLYIGGCCDFHILLQQGAELIASIKAVHRICIIKPAEAKGLIALLPKIVVREGWSHTREQEKRLGYM